MSNGESEDCGPKVFEVLRRKKETLSAKDIIEHLRAEGNDVDEGSVYRALFSLATSGSVERLPGKGGPARYRVAERAKDNSDETGAEEKK